MTKSSGDRKEEIIALIIFFIIGVACLIYSVYLYIFANNFMKNGEKTDAVIVDIIIDEYSEDSDWIIYVEYEVNGEKHIRSFNGNNWADEMEIGKTISIRYLKNDIYKIIYAKNEYTSFWLMFAVGAVATIFPVSRLSYILFFNEKQKAK